MSDDKLQERAQQWLKQNRLTAKYYEESLTQLLAQVEVQARLATIEEVAHFVETHWCENVNLTNIYKVHERTPHPNEPLAKAIRGLRQQAGAEGSK